MRKLSDYVDKVFIINLLSRKDRREFIISQLKNNGIYEDLISTGKIEFVDAVKLPGFNDNVLKTFNSENGGNIGSTGLYFCAVEHYRILKRALYYEYDRIMVLEDDACFLKDMNKFFDAMDKMPKTFDILHLEGFYWPDSNFPTEKDWLSILSDNIEDAHWERNTYFKLWATAALVYSRSGMEIITREQERIFSGADAPTFFADQNSYFYTYPLILQESKKVIKSDIVEYSNDVDDNNIYIRKANRDYYYNINDFQ